MYIVLLSCFIFSTIGVLGSLDGYMNIVLEQTEEYVNGQVLLYYDTEAFKIISLLF